MKTTIKDLYAGRPDAKDEINYDGLDEFIKTFVVPSNFDIERLVDKNDCFITGYKGTGKTALLFYLDDYIRNKDSSSCSSFIFFKEEFTDAKKTELEYMSHRILSSISINDTTMVSTSDFEYIWRWLFFKRIISDNDDFNGGLFVDDKNWNNFCKLMSRIKAPSNIKKTIIPPKIKLSMPCKDPLSQIEINPEVEVDFQNNKSDTAYNQFIATIDEAEQVLSNVERTDVPYYIFVDELEAYYGELDIFKRDLCLIRDLIFTVKRINGLFKGISDNTKIICSVRTEIIKSISRFIVTKEMNKVISGFEVPLIWDYNNTTSFYHPIMQILLRRIAICENIDQINSKEIYKKWFPEQIHTIEPANYILNNSWFKPRDIVRLITSAQNSIESSSECFSQAVFNACQKKYSLDSLAEICEEMRALYTSEDIDVIISCFTGFRSVFSISQLKKRIDSLYSNTILSKKFSEVIEDLYRLGFLGNYLPVSQTYRWQHKGDDHVILSDEWRLMIHHALQSALSVGKKQDFGLNYNASPQIGDVVEVTVYNIINSFAFVKFNKGKNIYEGVIHISQLSDSFIKKITDYVDYNDVFPAVIIAYDNNHQNWLLSKKKVTLIEKNQYN